jgi:oligopeptide transport system ATP-binding protein
VNDALELRDLTVTFEGASGVARPVDNVSWSVEPGRSLVILGESGSGKSMSVQAVAGIVPRPGKITSGEILWRGRDLLRDPKLHRKVRGREISMIFQDPLTSLNPVYTVGRQIGEMFRAHSDLSRKEAREHTIELLAQVRIPEPEDRVDRYPHELSGGMRQRVMIALAISQNPRVLIADEPTTALDTTVQVQIIGVLRELQRKTGMSIVLITHDIGVAAAVGDDVVVMYAGRVVESGPVAQVMRSPRHPYTAALLASVPTVSGSQTLQPITGTPPPLTKLPPGCRFAPRCRFATDGCRAVEPPLRAFETGQDAACSRSEEIFGPVRTEVDA